MPDLPTGTVTFLFTDIEGSTRLLQQLGDRYASVLMECRQLLRAAFQQWNGHEVDTQGDSFFVAFARATDAVSAAVNVQRVLFTRPWPEEVVMRVRLGLHTGEPSVVFEDYVGLDVHHAARIMSAGHGGQVLLSQTTRDLVEQSLPDGVRLRDLGEHRLKDLQRPSHLFQLVIAGLPTDFPPLKSLDAHPNNLPFQPTPLIGRELEVATVCALLRRPEVRLLTLSGPAGVGKTRLGLQVAAELVDLFANGVFAVFLAPVSDPDLVISALTQTLGMTDMGTQPPLSLLKGALKDKRLLLLLDNFEQVVEAALQVADLLSACPRLKVLVTSRVVLHVRAEREFAVPTLAVPNLKRLPELVALSQYDAVVLFIERALAVKPDFQVTNANAPAVAGICARLDGLPLAIELAAARVKYFLPQTLLARLEQGLAILVGGARDLPLRQQTLRGAFAWSYDLLVPEEQQLFRRLAVFVDGCTLEAAEAVCSAAGQLKGDFLEGLASLVDKSLLRQEEQAEGAEQETRFGMLQVLREFGLERLAEAGEMEVTRTAHATCYLALAEKAESHLKGTEQSGWSNRLEQEHENLRAALEWALEETAERVAERRELALRLSTALERFWVMRGPYSEARTFLERVLAGSEGESASLRVRILKATADIAEQQGDFDRAEVLAQQSLALCRELGDTRGIVNALSLLADVAYTRGKTAEGLALIEEWVRLMRQIGKPGEVAEALFNLADQVSTQGEYARGQALFEEALLLFRKAGNELWVGATLVRSALYLLWSAVGDVATVRQRLQQGQVLITKVGDRKWMAHSSMVAAVIALSEGETARAYDLAQESLAIYREMDYRWYIAVTLYVLGRVEAQRSDLRAARSRYVESLALAQEMGSKWIIPFDLEGLAGVLATQGQLRWAAQLWGAAEVLREGTAYPLPPVDRPSYEQAVSVARAQLGEQAFAAAWQEGRTMKLEQVIEDVLSTAG